MPNVVEGLYQGKGLKIGIVVSRFNELITKPMLEGALNELRRLGVSESDLYVAWVPGAFEIPFACQNLYQAKSPDAIIAIGCIIRGETSHYEHIAQNVIDGIQKVALTNNVPISLGVITVENLAQAMDRSGGKHGNKGRDAARSAVEMSRLLCELKNKQDKDTKLKELIEDELKK